MTLLNWSWSTCGPCSVFLSNGLPTVLFFARAALRSTNSSYAFSSTYKRDPAQQHRSEEHTSELQSHLNLVCRLLLEKKNIARPFTHRFPSPTCTYIPA